MDASRKAKPAGSSRSRRWALLAVAAAAAGIGVYTWSLRNQITGKRPPAKANGKPALLPAGSEAGYLDAASCTGCHREIWETYRRTGMGGSFSLPHAEAAYG